MTQYITSEMLEDEHSKKRIPSYGYKRVPEDERMDALEYVDSCFDSLSDVVDEMTTYWEPHMFSYIDEFLQEIQAKMEQNDNYLDDKYSMLGELDLYLDDYAETFADRQAYIYNHMLHFMLNNDKYGDWTDLVDELVHEYFSELENVHRDYWNFENFEGWING